MPLALSAILTGIFTFSLLVFLHEGGHFLAARAFGVRVHEFFIGLPGPKISFKRNETEYGVTAIPLGGYVRIAGMSGDPADERLPALLQEITKRGTMTFDEAMAFTSTISSKPVTEKDVITMLVTLTDLNALEEDENEDIWTSNYSQKDAEKDAELLFEESKQGTYLALSPWKRIVVLSSGVVVNILTAILVFTLVLSTFGFFIDNGTVAPAPNSPAMQAGMKTGDRIVKIDGVSVGDFDEISTEISKHEVGEEISLDLLRNDDELKVNATLIQRPEGEGAYLGIAPEFVKKRPNVFKSVQMSFNYIGMTLKALVGFFNPATFAESAQNSASIVGISVMAAKAIETSLLDYAWLVAAISLSLGIMNLLPIPPLDGGKIVLEIIGGIRKKDVPMKYQIGLSVFGFALLMTLVVYLTYNDIVRLINL